MLSLLIGGKYLPNRFRVRVRVRVRLRFMTKTLLYLGRMYM